jgi:hypothetical protein
MDDVRRRKIRHAEGAARLPPELEMTRSTRLVWTFAAGLGLAVGTALHFGGGRSATVGPVATTEPSATTAAAATGVAARESGWERENPSAPSPATTAAESATAPAAGDEPDSDSSFAPDTAERRRLAARAYTPAAVEEDAQVKEAVEGALRWLAREQAPNGAWIQDLGYKFNDAYNITGKGRPHVGVTALALMAFLSGGHLPGRGPYGKIVEKGTDYVLSCVDPQDGYIAFEGSRMYSHAFATLYLAEILGMTHRADVKEKLQLAVNLTAASQNDRGSWRYEPHSPESDMSITVCQVMALRAARNVGIRVNKKVIDNAYDYVIRSAETTGPERGGFHYQEKERTRTSFALTAAGVATLHNTGIYDHDLIRAGETYLRREVGRIYRQYAGHYFYWYGNYYASQVFFTGSDPSNPSRDQWGGFYWPEIRKQLLGMMQRSPNGSTVFWKNTCGPGDAFATSVAAIILQIPYQYLPIFQR